MYHNTKVFYQFKQFIYKKEKKSDYKPFVNSIRKCLNIKSKQFAIKLLKKQ